MNGAKALSSLLDGVTRGARARAGTTNFLLGSQALSDRLLSRMYFEVASRDWGAFASREDHLAPFVQALKALPSGRYERILDLGTGAGGSAAQLAEFMPDAEVVGLDRSRRMIREARRLFAAPNLSFRCGDAVNSSPFPEPFDLVTAHNFIPHPPSVHGLLNSHGVVIASGTYRPTGQLSRVVWEEAGFEIIASEDVGAGSFEVYRRV